MLTHTSRNRLLKEASSEEEKKQIGKKYEEGASRGLELSRGIRFDFLYSYKEKDKELKKDLILLKKEVTKKIDAIQYNREYQKARNKCEDIHNKMRKQMDSLKTTSKE